MNHDSSSTASRSLELDDVELRVLGVLLEKSLTQTGSYPLTMNAVVLGANQKQNREPVTDLGEPDVAKALTRLQQKGLVRQSAPSLGARSNRFEHLCLEQFKWDRREQAVMAELMLRGRQTPGELRTHASRMTPFQDLEAVTNTLVGLATRSTSFVRELPREPGRSANRWRHLLTTERDSVLPSSSAASTMDLNNRTDATLEDRIARLESVVSQLGVAFEELRRRIPENTF